MRCAGRSVRAVPALPDRSVPKFKEFAASRFPHESCWEAHVNLVQDTRTRVQAGASTKVHQSPKQELLRCPKRKCWNEPPQEVLDSTPQEVLDSTHHRSAEGNPNRAAATSMSRLPEKFARGGFSAIEIISSHHNQ